MLKISDSFLDELIAACLSNRNFYETVKPHLAYELIPTESHKFVWKFINTFHSLEEKVPSIGIISEYFNDEPDRKRKEAIKETLVRIKKSHVSDLYDQLLAQFQKYIKEQRFKVLYNDLADLYESNKRDEAIAKMAEESLKIQDFNLSAGYYDKVFEDFETRQEDKRNTPEDESSFEKIPTGIHGIDSDTRGGHKRGSIFGILARSGGGKSTFLRWCALYAARMGYNVFYFTCEGTKKDALNAFDAAWTATPIEDMEVKGISEERMKKLAKSLKTIRSNGGEIITHASEKFNALSIQDCYNIVVEYKKASGKPVDLILFDYLELFGVDGFFNGESGERRRREQIVEKMSNIATELNCVVGTATQANDIKPEVFNNPDKVITRSDISEFKGAIKPFSYFYTVNQTDDESDAEIMRLYADKYRFHKAQKITKIATSFGIGRFYNSKRSLDEFWDVEKGKERQ